MTSPYVDLDRPPLAAAALRRALAGPGRPWQELTVVAETGSTNVDLLAAAARGAASGTVLVAEAQTAARGRLDRRWSSPPRSGLTFSVLLRPSCARERWGWLPLLTGVAVTAALERLAVVPARLKWPNDVLVGPGKLAGILAQSVGDAVVIGVGLNVSTTAAELPPTGTSLRLAGAGCTDRDPLLRALLRSIAGQYEEFAESDGRALAADYRRRCVTLGRPVRVALPDGTDLLGTASDVSADGGLVVRTVDGIRTVAAGDVVHVRPAAADPL